MPAHADPLWWADAPLKERLQADPAGVLRDRGVNAPPGLPASVLHEFIRVTHLIWVDGTITPVNRFYIDPSDEGLLLGRGAWESTRTFNGVPWLWGLHLDRLIKTCDLLRIELQPERLPNEAAVTEYVRTLSGQDLVVRLNVTAGRPGQRGMVWMSAAPIAQSPPSIRLRTVVNPVQKGQAYLALKTFHYAARIRVGQLAASDGQFDTALLMDAEGNLQEASHANLFLRFADGWVTPPADGGLLPGTVRHFLLERAPFPIKERMVSASAIPEVKEAFVTNSNVGIVPVSRIDGTTLPTGPDTTALMAWLQPATPTGPQYRFVDQGIAR